MQKKWFKRFVKILLYSLGIFVLLLLGLGLYIYRVSEVQPPFLNDTRAIQLKRTVADSVRYTINNNVLQKNKYGLYEMYLEGDGFERGVIFGKLGEELIRYQEEAFTKEIQRMVPNPSYLKFLKYVVGFMNRDLEDHVLPEYRNEIYGVSISADQKFNWIGSKYTRQLNYHAAHDIGHALSNMMLVGCTSFATWNNRSVDSQLIIGRNFDFYVGDDFARNKIVAFYKPKNGIPFMSVTWGGFIGVVSGMNAAGLTVTINAAKSSIPSGAATPVSLVAREILQYAHNIDEAYAIAKKRTMFVSESFLIGSVADNKAVVIEKTPDELAIYDSGKNEISCANHYQSKVLEHQSLNEEQKKRSASVYRYQRLEELLQGVNQNTPQQTAAILRDYRGKGNADIGLTNEKAINQFICHHSIIFEPKKQLVWVSTSPWQMGAYVCYDLKKIVAQNTLNPLAYEEDLVIAPDTFLQAKSFTDVQTYLKNEQTFLRQKSLDPEALKESNPNYYDTYRLLGDYYVILNQKDKAVENYQKALQFEIATEDEREAIQRKLKEMK
ncbi:MAG: peptidase C45 [Chitinophagaceae bacterium]|nr:peptidase C45 [Chitinophagaceae bacterium]